MFFSLLVRNGRYSREFRQFTREIGRNPKKGPRTPQRQQGHRPTQDKNSGGLAGARGEGPAQAAQGRNGQGAHGGSREVAEPAHGVQAGLGQSGVSAGSEGGRQKSLLARCHSEITALRKWGPRSSLASSAGRPGSASPTACTIWGTSSAAPGSAPTVARPCISLSRRRRRR